MTEEEYRKAVARELDRRKDPSYLKNWSYLQNLRAQYPERYFGKFEEPPGIYGYTRGLRYSGAKYPENRYSVHILENMPPEEDLDTRFHEYSHLGIDEPRGNWAYIMSLQEPTPALRDLFERNKSPYRPVDMVEEGMIRHLGDPNLPTNAIVTNTTRSLTPTQQELLPYLKKYLQYGPQWGSIWGPEYDKEELRQGKGRDIGPKYNFHVVDKGMKMALHKADLPLSERIKLEEQNGYDLWGYIKKYGLPVDYLKGKGHLTDEFKLPNHVTFSTDSMYSTEETPGGVWTQDADKRWHYAPSDFVLSQHPREELREYFEKYEPESTLDLPAEEEDTTIRDVYSPRWRDLVR